MPPMTAAKATPGDGRRRCRAALPARGVDTADGHRDRHLDDLGRLGERGLGPGQHGVRHETTDDDGSDDRRQTDPPSRGHATTLWVADKRAVRKRGGGAGREDPRRVASPALGAAGLSGSGPRSPGGWRSSGGGPTRANRNPFEGARHPPAPQCDQPTIRHDAPPLPPSPRSRPSVQCAGSQCPEPETKGPFQGDLRQSPRQRVGAGAVPAPHRRRDPGLALVRPRPPSWPRPPPIAAARDTRPARSQ